MFKDIRYIIRPTNRKKRKLLIATLKTDALKEYNLEKAK